MIRDVLKDYHDRGIDVYLNTYSFHHESTKLAFLVSGLGLIECGLDEPFLGQLDDKILGLGDFVCRRALEDLETRRRTADRYKRIIKGLLPAPIDTYGEEVTP